MKQDSAFVPFHINASREDLAGNSGIGRYILMPGSHGRANKIAESFDQHQVKTHPRGHDLHLGTLTDANNKIEVATIASGMGCASMEIILHELFQLGAKRFLRVGTAGTLQPDLVPIGDLVNAQASVRDEQTTRDYMPIEIPAIASIAMVTTINNAKLELQLQAKLHTGTVHCKSSFYAREFGAGPQANDNHAYMSQLQRCGVLATEMETAALFIQTQLYNYELSKQGDGPMNRVLCGAILGILSEPPHRMATADQGKSVEQELTQLALASIKLLAREERTGKI